MTSTTRDYHSRFSTPTREHARAIPRERALREPHIVIGKRQLYRRHIQLSRPPRMRDVRNKQCWLSQNATSQLPTSIRASSYLNKGDAHDEHDSALVRADAA
jgi:hypothetical protein